MKKLKTDWIRAAVAGATVDGREIPETAIEQAANSYSQDVYNARIWPEHIRSLTPGGVFKSLGDVTDTKSVRIRGGALDGKLALYVKIEPKPELISMVRAGEKVHLSVELDTDFAKTNSGYLIGLGVTDSPASLGTGIMKFNAQQRTENLFSDLVLAEIVESRSEEDKTSVGQFAQVQDDIQSLRRTFSSELERLFNKLSDMEKNQNKTWEEVEKIGNSSAGRFRRLPAESPENSKSIDY